MEWKYIIGGIAIGIAIGAAVYFLVKALREKAEKTATSVVSTLPDVELEKLKEEQLKKLEQGTIVSTIA